MRMRRILSVAVGGIFALGLSGTYWIASPTEDHLQLAAPLKPFREHSVDHILFAKDFASSFDHYENFPDRFEAGYRLQLETFFAALREGRTPTPGPEDALETLRLAVAATRSWREKRPVKVSEVQA